MLNNLSKGVKGKFIIGVLLLIVIIGIVIMNGKTNTSVSQGHRIAILETNYGVIKIELYNKEMPITSGNFETLINKGFYNGVIFHRIIEGFMIQGGDPTGTGMGGPGYEIKDEFTRTALDRNDRGTISMANAGPNTGGSQFFINLVNNNYLDGRHPVFGKVVSGMDVVDKIAKAPTNQNDKPLKDVRIIKAFIE